MTGELVVIVSQRREHYMDDLALAGYCRDCDRGHTLDRARVTRAYLP